ncbi:MULTISPECIES: YbaB/EbfC family nucleoid-associated protein [Actinoplanes]|uniref:YbaB/EbfC DNA-binding family protein n=2 Tax=Actinoplanes TaxID=1865 RepID=A0A0X3V6X5_9ACTN|nr:MULTISPECIES: YbaB/EbfC family nucleoid-associated protein [Actinoplanes]KUL40559.1 hypothetical protein ADL15_06090 [Actinoplanes awajinensis subsp. mycoplanecinus]GIE71042.1 hypothetical protein Apa02nite_071500 [Actinoplanes palleronii]
MDLDAATERARLMREVVTSTSVEHTSDDHAVTVVAGPGGVLRDLSLSSRAFRLTGAELGALVVRTIHEANTLVTAEVAARMPR